MLIFTSLLIRLYRGQIEKRFIYASKSNVPDYMIKDGKEYKIISDQVGTPQMLVDVSSGKIVEEYEFDEFGNLRDNEDYNEKNERDHHLPFGFAGGLYDGDTKLVRFGARDYDSETGRWTAKDPIGFGGGDTNLYGYVLQNPVNLIDPKGTISPASITACIVLIAGGGVFDVFNTFQDQEELQKETESKLQSLEKKKRACPNDSEKLKFESEKQKILDDFQKKTLVNVASVFTPGAGTLTGVAACIAALTIF